MKLLHNVEPQSQGDSQDNLEAVVDLLINGRYLDVPKGQTPVERKLYKLSRTLHDRADADLKRMVGFSMNCNAAVSSTAEMMRSIREADSRTSAISAAAEEMVSSVQEISRNSDDVAAEAEQARDAASTVSGASHRAVESMQQISAAVAQAAAKVESLADASSQIGDIVQQIERIAKQTNLLALNATIEAARAGEAGKGFAVVAGEVKTLANQTARATDDIRSRIENLRNEMGEIVVSMEEGADAVEQGRAVITGTGEGMADVLNRVNMVSEKMRDVAGILSQQMEASREISQGITTIAQMSTENVQDVEQVLDVMDSADDLVSEAMVSLADLQISNFTIQVAKSDHMIWRTKLTEMAAGRTKLKASELTDHHACRLGKWYDTVSDPLIRQNPAFAALEKPHKEMHALGIEAAKRYANGDLDGALECIEKVEPLSADVIRLLDALAAGEHNE